MTPCLESSSFLARLSPQTVGKQVRKLRQGEGGRDLRVMYPEQMGGSEDNSTQEQEVVKQSLVGLPLKHTSLLSSLSFLLLWLSDMTSSFMLSSGIEEKTFQTICLGSDPTKSNTWT